MMVRPGRLHGIKLNTWFLGQKRSAKLAFHDTFSDGGGIAGEDDCSTVEFLPFVQGEWHATFVPCIVCLSVLRRGAAC